MSQGEIHTRGRLLAAGLAIGILAACIFTYPYDSDGAFAVNDPLHVAHDAEQAPFSVFTSHHPLHSLVVGLVTRTLATAQIDHPGHVAVRLVAGSGAIAILLILAGLAGSRRLTIGLLFAIVFLGTRGATMEALTGENVLPATAAAMWAFALAARSGVSSRRVGTALVLSLLLRQDNILMVPGLFTALALRLPAGTRAGTIIKLLIGSGVVTVCSYAAFWIADTRDLSFLNYLLDLALREGVSWAPAGGPDVDLVPLHLAALGAAVTGVQWAPHMWLPHALVGVGWIAVVIGAGWWMRGTGTLRPWCVGVLLVLLVRLPFFLWFEPSNWEWWLPTMALVVAACAAATNGQPQRRPGVGIAALLVATAATVLSHGSTTWQLRDRTLSRAALEAHELGGSSSQCRYIAYRRRAQSAFHLHGVALDHTQDVLSGSPTQAKEILRRKLTERPVRTVLLVDRFVRDGMPWTLRRDPDDLVDLDGWIAGSGERFLSENGRVRVLSWHLR